jgi:hypothetical protein
MSENNYNLDLYKFPTPELRFDVEVTPEGLQEALNIDLFNQISRLSVNIGVEEVVEDMEARGVSYGFGDKTGVSAIDCSGLITRALDHAFDTTDSVTGISFDENDNSMLVTHSDGQVANVGRVSGVLRGDEVNIENLKEGMIIGLDTGDRGWDQGRTYGIDHVGIVYRDSETGEMKFAQSSSGGGGVNIQNLDDYLESRVASRADLYAVDPVKLAEIDPPDIFPVLTARADDIELSFGDMESGSERTFASAADEYGIGEGIQEDTISVAFNSHAGQINETFAPDHSIRPEARPEVEPEVVENQQQQQGISYTGPSMG